MALRIAPGRHVENNSRSALLPPPRFGKLQPQLRFANAGRADNHRQSPRQQPAAEEFVESGDSGGESGHNERRMQSEECGMGSGE